MRNYGSGLRLLLFVWVARVLIFEVSCYIFWVELYDLAQYVDFHFSVHESFFNLVPLMLSTVTNALSSAGWCLCSHSSCEEH